MSLEMLVQFGDAVSGRFGKFHQWDSRYALFSTINMNLESLEDIMVAARNIAKLKAKSQSNYFIKSCREDRFNFSQKNMDDALSRLSILNTTSYNLLIPKYIVAKQVPIYESYYGNKRLKLSDRVDILCQKISNHDYSTSTISDLEDNYYLLERLQNDRYIRKKLREDEAFAKKYSDFFRKFEKHIAGIEDALAGKIPERRQANIIEKLPDTDILSKKQIILPASTIISSITNSVNPSVQYPNISYADLQEPKAEHDHDTITSIMPKKTSSTIQVTRQNPRKEKVKSYMHRIKNFVAAGTIALGIGLYSLVGHITPVSNAYTQPIVKEYVETTRAMNIPKIKELASHEKKASNLTYNKNFNKANSANITNNTNNINNNIQRLNKNHDLENKILKTDNYRNPDIKIDEEDYTEIYSSALKIKSLGYKEGELAIAVLGSKQYALTYRLKNNQILVEDIYVVSTGFGHFGNIPGSCATPLGAFQITDILGKDMPEGMNVSDGRMATISKDPNYRGKDLLTSRIFRISGLESSNYNSSTRGILFHGTDEEGKLGNPVSHGCVRFSNKDIISLSNKIDVNMYGEILL